MNFRLQIRKDEISPDLNKKIHRADQGTKLALTAAGQQVISITKRAFTDPSLRAQSWAPRKDKKTHALLQKSTMLRKSMRITGLTKKTVTVGSDRVYAGVQQLGSKKKSGGIPARPFFPIDQRNQLTPLASKRVMATIQRALKSQGLV